MKVLTPKEMAKAESQAYEEGCREDDFMEQAGIGVAHYVHYFCQEDTENYHILLLCAKGNNSGDAFAAGYHLLKWGYEVTAIHLDDPKECSDLCQKQRSLFTDKGGKIVDEFISSDEIRSNYSFIVDGLFGTGFKGAVREPYRSIIDNANDAKLPSVAIDIPSGLDGETGEVGGSAIKADATVFLGQPKLGFFIKEGWNTVGELYHVDFGLPEKYVEESDTNFYMTTEAECRDLLPSISRSRHKYQAGYVVGIAGSPTMPGASILSSISALKGGAGIIRLLHPEGMEPLLSGAPPEIIKTPYSFEEPESILEEIAKASAVFIGPGITTHKEAVKLMKEILPKILCPCVIDADALTILGKQTISLPKKTILTPHVGEMARLLHGEKPPEMNMEFLKKCQEFVELNHATLVLKGGPTWIIQPEALFTVNPTGNPGMATAGSGDVLTGILAAFLAQGLEPYEASKLGVFLHGLAGDFAADHLTPYSMIASDITDCLPHAFKYLGA